MRRQQPTLNLGFLLQKECRLLDARVIAFRQNHHCTCGPRQEAISNFGGK
jgi:hypothetical protein